MHVLGWSTMMRATTTGCVAIPACFRYSPTTTRTRTFAASTRFRESDQPAHQRRARLVPDDGRDRHAARDARRHSSSSSGARQAAARVEVVLSRAGRRGAASVVALERRLDRRPRSGASRGSSYEVMRTIRGRDPRGRASAFALTLLVDRLRGARSSPRLVAAPACYHPLDPSHVKNEDESAAMVACSSSRCSSR